MLSRLEHFEGEYDGHSQRFGRGHHGRPGTIQKGGGGGCRNFANKVEREGTQRDFLEAVQSMVAVTRQEVVGLLQGVTTEM